MIKAFVVTLLTIALAGVVVNAEFIPPGSEVQFVKGSPTGPIQEGAIGINPDNGSGNGAQIIFDEILNIAWQIFRAPGGSAPANSTAIGPATQLRLGSGGCLDVKDGKNVNGNTLQIWACGNGNPNQLFNINGNGTLTWHGKRKCVDLKDGKYVKGNPIQIWDCFPNNKNQVRVAAIPL